MDGSLLPQLHANVQAAVSTLLPAHLDNYLHSLGVESQLRMIAIQLLSKAMG